MFAARTHAMPHKVLHVIGRMDRGGVETWLMHTLRNIDRHQFEFHFLVQSPTEGAFDAEIRSLGGKLHYGGNPRNPHHYSLRFRDIVKRHGPFRAVHSHVYLYSGFVLKLASRLGVPIRIAHSHNARKEPKHRISRSLYEKLMKHWITRYATHRIGCSRLAGQALFGADTFITIQFGIDFARFRRIDSEAELLELKRNHRISLKRKIIGHIGRFVPEKNHDFLIHVFSKLVSEGIDVHLLLIGSGPLLPRIKQGIDAYGLSERCSFTGVQSDVVPFLRVMDLLMLPSQSEGLGIVGLESQAAGVPLVASTGVPTDVDVIPDLVQHIPLDRGPIFWASVIRERLSRSSVRRGDEFLTLQNSKFGWQSSLPSLLGIYAGSSTL